MKLSFQQIQRFLTKAERLFNHCTQTCRKLQKANEKATRLSQTLDSIVTRPSKSSKDDPGPDTLENEDPGGLDSPSDRL